MSAITWWSRFNEGKTFPAQHSHAGITNPDDRQAWQGTPTAAT